MSAFMNLLPFAKVELFSQSLHLPCQVHNEFDADNVETASGPQIFNAAQNASAVRPLAERAWMFAKRAGAPA